MAVGVLVAALAIACGWLYYQRLHSEARLTIETSLGAIADLKATDLAHWMVERRGDAEVARSSMAARAIAESDHPESSAAAYRPINVFREVYGYAAMVFANSQGRVGLIVPSDYPLPPSSVAEQIRLALRSRSVQVSDLRRMRPQEPAYLWLACPIFNHPDLGGSADGAVLLVIDPRTFLYPNVQRWPMPSRTGEGLLGFRDGNQVVYLNDLHLNTPSSESGKAGTSALPSLASQTTEGVFEAKDSRGVPVFAALRVVQGTPWVVVTKVDQEEVFAPLRREGWNIAIIATLLTIATLLGLYSVWRQQKLVYMRQELAEHTKAEQHIRRLNRLYAVLSSINALIVRERDVHALLSAACSIAINPGSFRMAWIGMLDTEGHTLKPVASFGVVDGYLDRFSVDLTESHRSAEPSAAAVLTGQSQIYNDIENDPGTEPWRDAALQRGYRSCASFPLNISGKAIGALTLFSEEVHLFDSDELGLLDELARNIAFALEVNRREIERERAEAGLRANEERFRLLIENASDIITILNGAGTLRFVSPSIKRCLGYDPAELLNLNVLDLVHPEDVSKTASTISGLVDDPSITAGVEYRFRHRDGSWRVMQSVGRSIPSQAPDGFVVLNSRDITESRELEKQFQQSQKMEAVGLLAGGVAHDFNNLLGVIMGYSDLILDALPPDDPQCRQIQQIKKAGVRATSLTRQLLAFSRKQVFQPEMLDVNALVTDFNNMLRRLIDEDIELVSLLKPELGRIKADRGQIEQVIMNLVVNSRDAMPSGGKLIIETANVEFDDIYRRSHPPVLPGRYVMISVCDTGVGMDAITQAHIFEPFFTTKEQGKGTGLGLAVVYGIVKQSEGFIWVYSELGKGTTFKIYFPRMDEPTQPLETDRREGELVGGSETVLLAEDSDALRDLTRVMLERNGYTVLVAESGKEAIKIAERQDRPIHLLLTDVVMPGMSGRELANYMEAKRPDMKVLYMSGYTSDSIVRHGVLELGISFIEKPFSQEALMRKLRDVLDCVEKSYVG